jgi:hypothetical protein
LLPVAVMGSIIKVAPAEIWKIMLLFNVTGPL